jgi:hypothetical protein
MALNDIANKDATILAITNYFSPLIKDILKSRIDDSGLTAPDKVTEKAKIDDLDFTETQEYQANIKSIVYKLYDNIVLFLGGGGGGSYIIPEAVTDVTFNSMTQTISVTKEPLTVSLINGGTEVLIPDVITNITFDSMTQTLSITREDFTFTI